MGPTNDSAANQNKTEKRTIEALDAVFALLHQNSCALIQEVTPRNLYRVPGATVPAGQVAVASVGESILRSAAAVEQTFGGLSANLWDDPFEWTLPEMLATGERIIEYLAEVEETRRRAFAPFSNDTDLLKEVFVPSGKTKFLISLLLETMVRASEYQGRAIATLKMLSDV